MATPINFKVVRFRATILGVRDWPAPGDQSEGAR